ncbi:MJ0042-type zinc finger domain-containing protein [Ureibacillus sp. GCM10028918]
MITKCPNCKTSIHNR